MEKHGSSTTTCAFRRAIAGKMTRHVLVTGLGKTWHDLCLSPGNRWKNDKA
jgi:hypothetical protein